MFNLIRTLWFNDLGANFKQTEGRESDQSSKTKLIKVQ